MKTIIAKAQSAALKVYLKVNKVKKDSLELFSNSDGDAYIDTVVKILIAVVVGALLLWGIYKLMGDTVLVELTNKIKGLFGKTQEAA